MIKISALPAAFGTNLTDIVPIVQSGVTKKLSIKDLTESLSPTEVVDSFELGATLNTRNQVLRLTATGALYRWNGALPKVVFPSSTPESSGGISAAAWSLVIQNQASGLRTVVELGVVGDGIVNDGPKLLEVLENYGDAVIPPGLILRIDAPFTMPLGSSIRFMGGLGNTVGQLPSSYLLKPASVSGALVTMTENCRWSGGGILGEAGNTGDGIRIHGNSVSIEQAFIGKCGGSGVRIGKDSAYQNCNSFNLSKVICALNGDDGIGVHDGWSDTVPGGIGGEGRGADANAGKLDSCFSYQNGGHGIYLGRTWWTTVINCLTEGNAKYGMFCDDAVVEPDTVARCRYVNIFGGDFNEGNTEGSLWFKGYAGNYYHADANQNIAYGGILNNVYGGGGNNINWGQTINRFLNVNALQGEDTQAKYPVQLNKTISGSAGDSCGFAVRAGTTNETQPYQVVAAFEAEFKEPNEWMGVIRVRDGNGDSDPGQLIRGLVVDPRFKRWYAGADNVWTLGDPTVRFSGMFNILPQYKNDADAAFYGLAVGGWYHNGDGVPRMRQIAAKIQPNEFRTGLGGSWIADGYATSATTGIFKLQTRSPTIPVSITVINSFTVMRISTGAAATSGAGKTPTLDTTKSSLSMTWVNVTGMSGLTPGEPLALNGEGGISSIIVNY